MVVHTAAVYLGIAIDNDGVSRWDLQSFNMIDPVKVALAGGLRESTAAHVAISTAVYRGPLAHFVTCCASVLGYPSLPSTGRRDYGGPLPPVSGREVFYILPREERLGRYSLLPESQSL